MKWFTDVVVQELTKDTAIPLEKAEADILMIAGEDDHNWDSVRWGEVGGDGWWGGVGGLHLGYLFIEWLLGRWLGQCQMGDDDD